MTYYPWLARLACGAALAAGAATVAPAQNLPETVGVTVGTLGNPFFQAGPFIKKGNAHVVEGLRKFGKLPAFWQGDAFAKALGGVGGDMFCHISGALQWRNNKRVEQIASNNQKHA